MLLGANKETSCNQTASPNPNLNPNQGSQERRSGWILNAQVRDNGSGSGVTVSYQPLNK